MNRRARRTTIWAVRAAGALTTAALVLGNRPSPAAACTASYGYRPRLDLADVLSRTGSGGLSSLDSLFGGRCSGALSLSASAVLVVAAVVAVTVFASRLLQRGEAAGPALNAYLSEVGLPSRPAPPEERPPAAEPDRPGSPPDPR